MSVLDRPMRVAAKRLAERFGKVGTIGYTSTGAYNPTTGEAPLADETRSATGVVESYSAAEIDGTLIRRADMKWTIPAQNTPRPRPNDWVEFSDVPESGGSIRHTVVSVDNIYSGEEAALYVLQLRR